jgi:putative hydrolase
MTPFGFSPDDDSDDPKKEPFEIPINIPIGPDGNPDFAALFALLQSQMQSEFGGALPENMAKEIQEQFAKLGITPMGFMSATSGTDNSLPLDITRDIAKKFVSTQGFSLLGNKDVAAAQEAMELADLWLNDATVFPAHTSERKILSRADWIDATMAGWKLNIEPLASGLSKAMTALIENQDIPDEAIPMTHVASLLKTFIGSMIATQLGQCLGGLATSVTGAHDVGLPLLDPARPALLPENIAQWGADIGINESEVRIFHALREGAVARLFDSNPWLIQYMRNAISDYGLGIRIDMEAMQRQAEEAIGSGTIDPNNPETFSLALNEGMFTPEESPEQIAALTKLETALALIDGWTDDVITLAAGDRLPSLDALRETLRRRRATSSPAQQLFSALFGLEVSPRLSREASAFWKQVRDLRDISDRDQIWSGILPTNEELTHPELYLASVEVPDDLSGLDLS